MSLANVNSAFVIDSIPDGDCKTGHDLYYDVIKVNAYRFTYEVPFTHGYYQVNSKSEFIEALKDVNSKSISLVNGVVVHIELHGSSEGIHFRDCSMLKWEEIQNDLIKLNVSLDNQLYISMAACEGRFLHETIDMTKKAPFCAMITSKIEVSPQQILDYYHRFFETLVEKRDLIMAYNEYERMHSPFYYHDVQVVYEKILITLIHRIDNDDEYRESLFPVELGLNTQQKTDFIENLKFEKIKQFRLEFLFGKARKTMNFQELLTMDIDYSSFD